MEELHTWARYKITMVQHKDAKSGKVVWKKHVNWSFDDQIVDEQTRTSVHVEEESEHEAVGESEDPMVKEMQAPSRAPHYRVSRNLESMSTVQLAYREGAEVEYFSSTHQKWFLGTVSLEALGDGDDRLVRVIYNVRVGLTRQLRHDVGLELLRIPLREGDLVEVGEWHLQRGAVARITKIHRLPMNRHYEVLLESEQMRQVVAGNLLRRHFPLGSAVFAYRGQDRGWVRGLVHERLFERPDENHADTTEQTHAAPRRKGVLPCVVVDVAAQNHTVRSLHELAISFPDTKGDMTTECVASHLVHSTSAACAGSDQTSTDGSCAVAAPSQLRLRV